MKTTTTQNTKSASKKSKTKISIANSTELHRLKKTINTSAEAVESLVKSVKDKSRQALAEALICGKALVRVKEIVKFGQFEKWCAENCKGIERKTVQRYTSLATRGSHLLATGIGLRQAYIALGILKEDDSETSLSNTVGDASLAGTIQMKANKASATPLANQMAKANGNHAVSIVTPEISITDHLSRARYLTQQLLGELNSKITIKGITLSDLENETLNQIAAWFKQQRA
jgi:hypothetical protein